MLAASRESAQCSRDGRLGHVRWQCGYAMAGIAGRFTMFYPGDKAAINQI